MASVQAEPLDAVVVVTGAVAEVGVGAVVLVGRRAAGEWVAQGVNDAGGVALGHGHLIGHGLDHRLEPKAAHRSHRAAGGAAGQGCAAQCGSACATEQAAPAQARAQHVVERGVVAGVGVFVVEVGVGADVVVGHGNDLG